MVKVICGPKGSGKTKRIIEAANEAVAVAKGNLIFITDTKRYMYDLKREVRFIDTSDYSVAGEDALALGSDFDGIPPNSFMPDPSHMPALLELFADEFGGRVAEKIAAGNFLRVFEEVCG